MKTKSFKEVIASFVIGFIFIGLYVAASLDDSFKLLVNMVSGFCVGLAACRFGDWTAGRWFSDGHRQDNSTSDPKPEEKGDSNS